jgi:cyclomaltodextrin glucanotransferase
MNKNSKFCAFFIVISLSFFSVNLKAEWFLRGTHNGWIAAQMNSGGPNTVELNNVVFANAGAIKFDRFGNWSENYGVGGRNGTNIPVAAGTWKIQFFTDTKNWAISPVNSIAIFHLRGTFNAWAEGTLMTRVGTSDIYEKCQQFTGGDANGGPRFKIDPNGGWGSDAVPATDYGVNAGWVKIAFNSTTKAITVEQNLGTNCGTVTADDFRARTMYFVFVDRFANGNTANDNGLNPAATSSVKSAGGISEWKKYWGGDIQGLIDQLDYLKDLGVSAIWVTPLMQNIIVGTEGGYHGYWARDFYKVDEHLGDWALVDQLDRAMEDRGMKLVLDIALNHSNQDDSFEFGALFKDGVFVTNFASGKGTWYHNNGAIADCGDNNPETKCGSEWDNPWTMRNKSLFNLADFNHGVDSNSQVDQYLIDAALKWMDHGVDAFRIDAIKHIEPNFINRFSAAVRAKKPDTYIFGEWVGAGVGHGASLAFLNERRGSELLDFKLRDAIENAIAGNNNMIDLSAHIQARPSAMNGNDSLQAIFLDNHDDTRTSVYLQESSDRRVSGKLNGQDRFGKNFGKSGAGKLFAEARQNLGTALVMTLPGIPTIYYGSEQNSTWFEANGEGLYGHDPFNRESMPSFSKTTAAYVMIKALSDLRKVSPAIQRGSYAERWVNSDVLVFQRQEGSDCVVVAVNRGVSTTISVPNLCKTNGNYVSKVGVDTVTVTAGTASFNLSQNEVVVIR